MKKTFTDYIYDLYNYLGLFIILIILGLIVFYAPLVSFQNRVDIFNRCTKSNISYFDAIWVDLKITNCNS